MPRRGILSCRQKLIEYMKISLTVGLKQNAIINASFNQQSCNQSLHNGGLHHLHLNLYQKKKSFGAESNLTLKREQECANNASKLKEKGDYWSRRQNYIF